MMSEHAFRQELLQVLREMRDVMASLDQDVQDATTVINDLVAALATATGTANPVPAADQTALETAIAAGQAALAPAEATSVVSDPAVS